ncbi:MAG TPA: hypothetical protein VHK88_06760 [Aquihabitans sp.]|nr:hypothetical protein [Aquihabitans sp.]
MGFLDKVKAQAEQTLKQGQEKLDEVQAKKRADGLLRDLGAWYYATQTGRDGGKGETELVRITGELQAHEAEHGPLGGRGDDDEPTPGPEAAPVPPPPGAEPTPPPPGASTPPPAGGTPPPPPAGMPPSPMPPASTPPMPAAPPVPPPATSPTDLPGGGPGSGLA